MNGLGDVSARQIVREAGQKNVGSINYYFQSQENLIAGLVQDMAGKLDKTLNARLDAITEGGEPDSIREIVKVMVQFPVIDTDEEDFGEFSFRFIIMLELNHRDRLVEALRGYDTGVRRCFKIIIKLTPELAGRLMQQRLMHVFTYVVATGSAREAARSDEKTWLNLWGAPTAEDNLVDTTMGMILQPPSDETLGKLNGAGCSPARNDPGVSDSQFKSVARI